MENSLRERLFKFIADRAGIEYYYIGYELLPDKVSDTSNEKFEALLKFIEGEVRAGSA